MKAAPTPQHHSQTSHGLDSRHLMIRRIDGDWHQAERVSSDYVRLVPDMPRGTAPDYCRIGLPLDERRFTIQRLPIELIRTTGQHGEPGLVDTDCIWARPGDFASVSARGGIYTKAKKFWPFIEEMLADNCLEVDPERTQVRRIVRSGEVITADCYLRIDVPVRVLVGGTRVV